MTALCGSRTRDGLYNEDSDVDVVIAYEGTVREDDLFSVLNEAGYKVGNMKVDMNPIRPDKTGALEEFLEKSDRYLDEKMEQMKARGEYKPLAKVEELEEANYNMIDNVLNNMPPKKEPYLEYYAAECDEYHSLGNIYKSTNLDEILAKYREIIDDPSLSYYGNGMGIIYRDPNDTFYDEAEVSLVSRKAIRGDSLDEVAFLAAIPMVHEALEKIVEAFPDFRYYPPKELIVHYYPDKMTADELSAALDQLAEDFDHYDYHDNFSPEEDMVETVALELRYGYAHRYIPFLKDIIDEECEESPRAEELLEKLKAYQPEIPETAVPVVRIDFCEDKEMDISGYQNLGSLNEITAKMDEELASQADPKTGMPEKTVQMYFTIYYPDHDQMQELKGKINIGDGNGGIVSQLKNQNEMKLHDESWLNYQKGKDILERSDEKDGAVCWVADYMDEYGLFLARNIRQIELLRLDTLGTIVLNIDVNALVRECTDFDKRYGETAYVITKDEDILFHTKNLDLESLELLKIYGIEKYEIEKIGDTRYFISHGRIDKYDWNYYCLVSYEQIAGQISRIQHICLWIILLDVLAISWLTITIIGKIVVHISSLKNRMQRFALDNTKVPEAGYDYSTRRDELGTLNRQFDEMSMSLTMPGKL